MKNFFLILIILTICNPLVSAQEANEKKKTFPLNEFSLSLNRTTVSDENTQDRFGFGVGIYYAFFNQKRCNLVTGLEYNRNVQYKKHMYGGRFKSYSNITCVMDYIGLPVYFRVNMGQKLKFFVETGAFFDFIAMGKIKGEYETYLPYTNKRTGTFNHSESWMVNFGVSGGVGLRIPIQKYEILLKGDYKWGMRDIYGYHDSIYNRYWRFTVGFKINSKK